MALAPCGLEIVSLGAASGGNHSHLERCEVIHLAGPGSAAGRTSSKVQLRRIPA